jgi:hypothetical protein
MASEKNRLLTQLAIATAVSSTVCVSLGAPVIPAVAGAAIGAAVVSLGKGKK